MRSIDTMGLTSSAICKLLLNKSNDLIALSGVSQELNTKIL